VKQPKAEQPLDHWQVKVKVRWAVPPSPTMNRLVMPHLGQMARYASPAWLRKALVYVLLQRKKMLSAARRAGPGDDSGPTEALSSPLLAVGKPPADDGTPPAGGSRKP
jgi:hypothetical protein